MNAAGTEKAAFLTQAAAGCNLLFVRRTLTLPALSAEALLQRLAPGKQGFLLEGAAFTEETAGKIVIGVEPLLRLQLFANHALQFIGTSCKRLDGKPLEILQRRLDTLRCPQAEAAQRVCGKLVGYLDYDAVATWERVRGANLPEARLVGEWMLCRSLLFYDPKTRQAEVVCQTPVRKRRNADRAYAAAERHLEHLVRRLAGCREAVLPGEPVVFDAARDADVRRHYMDKVSAAKQYIQAGDAFQIVISQPFAAPAGATLPLYRYRQLKQSNPSPYMFYFFAGRRTLLGTSPEMLVRVLDGRAYSRPIAGTRRKTADAATNAALAAELRQDEKECAEHAMLVDLSRNDLGRIAAPGSVVVKDIMRVEQFARVMHMVSDVEADCESGTSATAALAACFPAGTVSGAPKVRAMEIIRELEQDLRGPYAGAFGWLGANGDLDTCIVIRTAWQEDGVLSVRVGAGIVADSDPAKEYEEIQTKAAAVFAALEAKQDDSAHR